MASGESGTSQILDGSAGVADAATAAAEQEGESRARSATGLDRRLTREAKRLCSRRYAKQIRRDDPRLRDSVRDLIASIGTKDKKLAGRGATLFQVGRYLLSRQNDPQDPRRVVTLLRKLHRTVDTFSRLALDNELQGIAAAAVDKRRAQIVGRLFGWDGGGTRTLQSVGDEVGLSRERIRQIASRFGDMMVGRKPFAPSLDRTLRLITRYAPDTEEIHSQLMAHKLVTGAFQLDGIAKACDALGRRAPFKFQAIAEVARLVRRAGRKSIEHWGVASIADVANRVASEHSQSVSPEFVARTMQKEAGFRWLDAATGWFWLAATPRNRAINQMRKILSVTSHIDVSELREGMSRHYRVEGFAPPRRVLLELCRQIPEYKVEDQTISADPPLDYERVLAETERTMTRIMLANGRVMRRGDFESRCLEAGMKRSTFYMYLDYSPILARYAPGVYGLRGANVTPGQIQTLIPGRTPQKVVLDNGWTKGGQIWIAARLSQAVLASGVLGIPSGVKRFVNGQFRLKTEDGLTVGMLNSRGGSAWGFAPFFAQRGGEPGDHLTIVLDPKTREAVVHLGDDRIIDQLRSGDPVSNN